ncbi:hypothetical protein, partial [Amaricoccus sp.]|uniref:hypothetical protein n=1 Tax=Amaricoccus sp. TaxID=1872485 RepID=UPI002D1FA341
MVQIVNHESVSVLLRPVLAETWMVDGQVWVRMGRRLGCVSRPQAGGREHSARPDPSQKKEGRGQPQCGAEAA